MNSNQPTDQQHVVQQRHDDRHVGRLTAQDHRPAIRVRVRRMRQVHRDPRRRSDRLNPDQAEADRGLDFSRPWSSVPVLGASAAKSSVYRHNPPAKSYCVQICT